MAVTISIDTDAREVLGKLKRINRRGIGFAWDKAVLEEAKEVKQMIHRQYGFYVKRRKKSFPRSVINAYREGASKRTMADGRVRSHAADDVLRRMFDGGVKRPKKASKLYVPFKTKAGNPRARPKDDKKIFVNKRGIVFRKETTPTVFVVSKKGVARRKGGKRGMRKAIGVMKRTTRDTGPVQMDLSIVPKRLAARVRKYLAKEYQRARNRIMKKKGRL